VRLCGSSKRLFLTAKLGPFAAARRLRSATGRVSIGGDVPYASARSAPFKWMLRIGSSALLAAAHLQQRGQPVSTLGLDVAHLADFTSAKETKVWARRLKRERLTDADAIRAGIALAFDPYLPMP